MKNISYFLFLGLLTTVYVSSCTKEKSPAVSKNNPFLNDTISYSVDIEPLIMQNCSTTGCHDAATAESGYNLTTYESIKSNADKIYSAMSWDGTVAAMPFGGEKLDSNSIYKFEAWILQGKLDN